MHSFQKWNAMNNIKCRVLSLDSLITIKTVMLYLPQSVFSSIGVVNGGFLKADKNDNYDLM